MEQQYQLAKYANISIRDSEFISDIDRDIYFGFIIRDKREENEYINSISNE